MANTLTVLSRDPNRRRGGELQRTTFSVVLAGNYVAGGEDIDLSSYFRRILGVKITPLQVQPGYEWGVDNTLFASTRHVLAMLFRRGVIATADVATALNAHAVHLHDLLLEIVADAAGDRVNSALGPPVTLGRPVAGATVVGVQATRGVQNIAAVQAHAGSATAIPAAALAEYTNGVAYPAGLNFLMEVLGD